MRAGNHQPSQRLAMLRERVRSELAHAEEALWLLALATLTVDVYLTYVGLQAGLSEGNPFMATGFETVGFAVLGLTKAVVLGCAGFARELRPEYGPYLPLGLAVPWLVAVVVNGIHLL